MKRTAGLWIAVGCLAADQTAGMAQDAGYWRAESTTARGVTGDIALSERKVTISFSSFTIAEIRDLTPAERAATFDGEPATEDASGHLYRLSIPAEKRFLHKNSLCGSEETQWMVTVARGKGLRVAFFSGSSMPVLTVEGLNNSTSLCGTFAYVR